MIILQTTRLIVRQFSTDDAPFILRLLNEPSFIQNIADRGVRTLEDARNYLVNGPIGSYHKNGFGLWLAASKESSTPMGMCGLIRRDSLEDVDIGYAFLPEFWSQGYALEAASAVLGYAKTTVGLKRVVAIVSPHNQSSIKLLQKIGFTYEKMITLPGDDEEIKLFGQLWGGE